MITDLVQIRRLGEKNRDENLKFRLWLKSHNYVERRFRKIAQNVEETIDCTTCANCCRLATVRLAERDVPKLARFLRISPAQFLRDYTEVSETEGLILKRTEAGCVFLAGTECTVYEARPGTCADFPHLVRGSGSFVSRMWQFADRAVYCPIVYNSLEEFKAETRFRPSAANPSAR